MIIEKKEGDKKDDDEEIVIDSDINTIQKKLIGLLIDDFVKDEYSNVDINMETVMADLQSEKLLNYIQEHYAERLQKKFGPIDEL